jgi:hypothetical protein
MAVSVDFLDPEPLRFHSMSSSGIITRLNGPRSRPTYFSENVVAPGIKPGTSGSLARNSDHQTKEAVIQK